MELILNDLSLHGQFAAIDDFEDYFTAYLNRMIDFIIKRKVPLLKKSDTYNHKITKDITMATYLREASNDPLDIVNIGNARAFLDAYLEDDMDNVRFVIEHYQENKVVKCAEVSGKCYTESALLGNGLNRLDIRKFVDNIQTLISDKSNGRKTH